MIYEQRTRNLWISRIIGTSFVAVVVLIIYCSVVLVFGGDAFIFVSALTVVAALMVLGYLRSDRWVINRFSDQLLEPPRQAREALEEMAIAAGIPRPILYVIDTGTLNAFAVGRDPSVGIVCVTRGLVDTLDKDELCAVMAHEVAHIKDGDSMAGSVIALIAYTANRLAPAIFITMLSFAGFVFIPVVGPVLAIAGVACLSLPPAMRAAQMYFGRTRELLADDTAVLLMRDPEPLIRALEKIDSRSGVVGSAGFALSHLFITSPRPWWNTEVISTHPPIEKRIGALRHTTAVPVPTEI